MRKLEQSRISEGHHALDINVHKNPGQTIEPLRTPASSHPKLSQDMQQNGAPDEAELRQGSGNRHDHLNFYRLKYEAAYGILGL